MNKERNKQLSEKIKRFIDVNSKLPKPKLIAIKAR